MKVRVFADGSCVGNPGPTAIGVVFLVNSQVRVVSKYTGYGTNNTAEIKAAILALASIRNKSLSVTLYTDSQLVVGFLSQNWRAKANKKLVSELVSLAIGFKKFKVVKVRAHQKVDSYHSFWNDCADKLAKGAVMSKGNFSKKWNLRREGDFMNDQLN